MVSEWIQIAQAWLEAAHPAILPAAIIILPLLPFPVSILLISISARYNLPVALAICALGLTVNMSLAYLLSQTIGRPVIEPLLRRFGYAIPTWQGTGARKVILLFRVTPGIPLFVQNYALGLSGVALRPYLLYSIPIIFAYASAFVIFGAAVFSGKLGWTLTGILAACAILLGISLWRDRLRKNAEKASETPPSAQDR